MKLFRVLYLILLVISGYYAQDPTTIPIATWNGDPTICTVNPNPPTGDRPVPRFSNKAEFTLELVQIRHILDQTFPSQLTLFQYIYDYDNNKLILVQNSNGAINVEYFYYERLKKAIYLPGDYCKVDDITKDTPIDGKSATQLTNGTWHIRPLNEFLLFSSNNPREEIIRPQYIGETIVRGIPVDQWETCIIDRSTFQTSKRTWYFARRGFLTPLGPVGDLAVPVQAIINASVLFSNGTRLAEFDEIFDVYSYKPGILETSDQLAPPRGVFCGSGDGQQLMTLQEAGMTWPERFSVRVEASTSRSSNWGKFHLRFDRGRERGAKRIRYDYLPNVGENYFTVIHDYGTNLTYKINLRLGTCQIKRGVENVDVNPMINPIEFFIKNEDKFLSNSRDRIWESNGFRTCRGNAIKCASVVTSIDKFPPIIEPDTDLPSGETWLVTNMEYGWSVRAPFARPRPDTDKTFDYPVYLFLRSYRLDDGSNPSLSNLRRQEIEYEFYQMSYEVDARDFDTSICYRSADYEYLHLGFKLQLDTPGAIDGNHLDRRSLERNIHANLVDQMGIQYSRVSDLEAFHEGNNDDISVLFTLLGPTPDPDSASGLSGSEPSADVARTTLKNSIDNNKFKFTMKLANDMTTDVSFKAVSNSLMGSKLFMSSYASGKKYIKEYYTKGAQAGAIIGGLIVGLIIGILIAAAFRIIRKEPMPSLPSSFSNRLTDFPRISFHNTTKKEPAANTTDA